TTRRLSSENEAGEIRSGFRSGRYVFLASQSADLHERARDQLDELGGRVGRAHQGRADENRVGAGELRLGALRSRADTALGDDDPVAWGLLDKGELRPAVDLEGVEIPRVDADHRRVEPDRALELLRIVGLDERVEVELRRVFHEISN